MCSCVSLPPQPSCFLLNSCDTALLARYFYRFRRFLPTQHDNMPPVRRQPARAENLQFLTALPPVIGGPQKPNRTHREWQRD